MILKEGADLTDIACEAMSLSYSDIKMCELGDQIINRWRPRITAKNYFIEKGIKEHISIDWNGENGALIRDLSKPVNEWQEYFDIVSNFGTSEHVENQYHVFRNIHNFCKTGGTIVHLIPAVGSIKGHGLCYYTTQFITDLSNKLSYKCFYNDYRVMTFRGCLPFSEKERTFVCSVLLKEKAKAFISEDEFSQFNENGIYYAKP